MAAGDVELLRRAWEVRWYGAGEGEEPDGCHNRDEAVAFIRLALADGVTAELLDIRDAGDRVVLIFQRHQPPDWGERPEPHGELVTVRDAVLSVIVAIAAGTAIHGSRTSSARAVVAMISAAGRGRGSSASSPR